MQQQGFCKNIIINLIQTIFKQLFWLFLVRSMIELKILYATKEININSINPQNSLKIDAKKNVHSIVIINVMRCELFSCLEK